MPAPVNDNFVNAQLITGVVGSTTFSVTNATYELPTNVGTLPDVWFKWIPTSHYYSATFTTSDTPAPRWDSIVRVYTGASLPLLTLIASNDDGDLQPGVDAPGGRGTSTVLFTAAPDTTYYVQVVSYNYSASYADVYGNVYTDADAVNSSAGYPRDDAVLSWTAVEVSTPTPTPPPPPPPPPDPSTSDGSTVQTQLQARVVVSVYDQDGVTLIANLPRRKNVQWLNELNAPGTGTFDIHRDDQVLKDYGNVLDYFNVVVFWYRGVRVKEWVIEDVTPTFVSSGERSDEFITIAGRGTMATLEAAVVYPEYGVRENAAEVRHFDFTSKDGVWRITSDWVTPAGVAWSADTSSRHTFPTGWPDPTAQWLWATDPTVEADPGFNWFRSTFTTTVRTSAMLYFSADNTGTVYIDGEAVGATGTDEWSFKTLNSFPIVLAAGLHTIAAVVQNYARNGGPNPGGMIISIMTVNAAGDPTTSNVYRSLASNTIVKAYGDAPAWHAANILQQLLLEAQQRDVTAVAPLSVGFGAQYDTDGTPWIDKQDRTINIGTTDLLDLTTQLIEAGMDVAVENSVVHAWIHRGTDHSATIILLPGRDVTAATPTRKGGRVRNQALLKNGSGWVEIAAPVSKDFYGRRETGLSIGNAQSTDQLITVGSAAMREVASAEETIPLSYTSLRGPQPHTDFYLGDIVRVPSPYYDTTIGRLMSVAGSEQEGYVQWDLDFYPYDAGNSITSSVIGVGDQTGSADTLYRSEVLSDSPWGYWRLQETTGTSLSDASGHGRTLTITGAGATLNQTGPVNKAIAWSSVASYASRSSSPFQQGIATLECWVNIAANPDALTTVLGMAVAGIDGTSHDKELAIDSNGRLTWYTSFAGVTNALIYFTALSLNTWYHVAASVGPDGKKLYVNGAVVASNGTTNSYSTNPQIVLLHGGGSGFNGHGAVQVAEPALYPQQLFDSRINSHYIAVTG